MFQFKNKLINYFFSASFFLFFCSLIYFSFVSHILAEIEILKPTDFVDPNSIWTNEGYAYDYPSQCCEDTTNADGDPEADPSVTFITWASPGQTHTSRNLYVVREVTGDWTADTWGIYYSTNGGSGWTAIETGDTTITKGTTTAVVIDTGLADLPNNLQVKVIGTKYHAGTVGSVNIFDVYLSAEYTPVSLTCDVSPSSLSFGALTTSQVYTALDNATTTITADASGFILSIYDSGNGSNPGLYNSTGTVTDIIGSANASFGDTATLEGGTEGYGIQIATTTAGSGAWTASSRYMNKTGFDVGGLDQGSGNAVNIASSTGAVTEREIVITHKAAISSANTPGDYKDTITYTCVAN